MLQTPQGAGKIRGEKKIDRPSWSRWVLICMVTQRMEHGASYRADLEPRWIQDSSPGSELSNGAIQSFEGLFYGSVC